MALISCKNASFAYDENIVLNDISFEINKGDYICIVGENGSGKSTLVKGILGLQRAFKGEIIYGESLKPQDIGYMPQKNNIQKDFPASVYEVVISGRLNKCGLRPFYSKADKIIADENLEKLDILDLKYKRFMELSVGQQQRVLIARALCSLEKLLILDEPAGALDYSASSQLYKTIEKINNEGITIAMISHDLKKSIEYGQKILHLQNKQLFFGDTQTYIKSDIGRLFLEAKNV
ncbi:MAG: metal ABC transporter ATP-binding protein [Elusimicrobiota bacterium]|jgi:zinc transport system ATP-binding protein|nr:metal ABC transporter ATP-binding protein [Elusimicrobiota bacterium]